MKKYLVLAHNINKYLLNSSASITELYKHTKEDKLLRSVRKLVLASGMGESFFLCDWYRNCDNYDCIILFDTGNADYLINLIHKKAPDTRFIFWYWNPVDRTIPINKINRNYCEVWSYHKGDCEKYGLHYNTQFYIPEVATAADTKKVVHEESTPVIVADTEIKQDVYFVGADKNRTQILYEMKEIFEKMNISYKFILTPCKGSKPTYIPYSKPIGGGAEQKKYFIIQGCYRCDRQFSCERADFATI